MLARDCTSNVLEAWLVLLEPHPQLIHNYTAGEVLFPGLDLDSGLDWTLDWTLEKMYFRCHCSAKEARGPMPCPLEAQTLNHVHISR